MILHEQLQNTVRKTERWPKLHALLRKGQVESKECKIKEVRLKTRKAQNENSKNQLYLLIPWSSPLPLPSIPVLSPQKFSSRSQGKGMAFILPFGFECFVSWWGYTSLDFKCASDATFRKRPKELVLVIFKLIQTELSQSLQMNIRNFS